MATSNSSWPVPLVISRTLSINSYAGFTLQATPYDFNNYLAVFQNMLTFNGPASSVNTTSAIKTVTIVNQTTSEKTPLLTSAAGLLNLNRFHNQSLYTSHPYFIPPSSSSDSLHNRTVSTFRTYLAHPYSTSSSNMSSVVNSNNKTIMLGFDDGWKSQILYAKPILDTHLYVIMLTLER